MGVGVLQKTSALCKGAGNVFSYISLLHLFSFLHCYTCIFFWFPQRVRSDLEVRYEKSMWTIPSHLNYFYQNSLLYVMTKKNYYWLFNHFYMWRELIFMFFMQLLLGLETNRVQWCSPLVFFFRFCCDIITLAVSAWSNWAYTVWGLFFDRLCTTFSGMDQTCVRMITVWKRLLDQT